MTKEMKRNVNIITIRLLCSPCIEHVDWIDNLDEVVFKIKLGDYNHNIVWDMNVTIVISYELFTLFNIDGIVTIIKGKIRKELLDYTKL